MLRPVRRVSLAGLVFVLSACGSGAAGPGGSPPVTPGPTPAPRPSSGGVGPIDHATGPADLVLRFEEGGGFVAPAFLASQAPIFTLYGEGTVVFRNPAQDPLPAVGSVFPACPFRIAHLSEDQIQKVLADALGRGGLGTARTEYVDNQIADAPTAVFTINAGGISKHVSVYALGIDVQNSPDAPARAAFDQLAERLGDFDHGGAYATSEYAPDRYRGILLEGQPGAPDSKPWPWNGVAPSDFLPNPDPNAFQFPARVMSVSEVEALGITLYSGGFQGLTLAGPADGKTYSFSLRPLLPDEPS